METKLGILEAKSSSQEVQTLLKLKYRGYLKYSAEQLPKFDEVGFKAYSQ